MRNRLIVLAVLILTIPCSAATITVNWDGSGDFTTIQAGINDANDGDTVLVADGIYTGDGNRDIDFHGKPITVKSANGPENCIIESNGTETEPHRGFYFHTGEEQNSVLDGFTITNGCTGEGGGIMCWESSPTITNNIITNNRTSFDADGGGGIKCRGGSPTIKNNTISHNSCPPGGGGGGIRCYEADSPTITDNIISHNTASQGAGMLIDFCTPTISNCTFTANSTDGMGGGILIDGNTILVNCIFSGNTASRGAGMYIYHSDPTLLNCSFTGNSADNGGGGMYNSSSSPTVTGCTFSGNSAKWGGGIYNVRSSPTLAICIFNGNSASSRGGGIQNEYSDTTVTGCTFTGNSASSGGGMSQDSGNVKVTRCTFSNNIANSGGGMINLSSLTLSNCTFTGNSAIRGGGMFNDYGTPAIDNCTFSGNSAELGGGIYCYYSDSSMVTNCILWGNTADSGSQIALDYSYNQSISYCDIWGGWAGEGNIDVDPLFADPNGPDGIIGTEDDNLRLLAGSPCIDAGDNSVVDANSTDLDGNPRIINGIVDMGAYEALGPIEADVHIVPRVINRRGRMKRIVAIVRLPEGINKGDVSDEPFVLYPGDLDSDGIEAMWDRVIGRSNQASVFALFDKAELMDAVEGVGRIELTVVGKLESGQYIYGSDTVRIIEPQRRRGRRRGRW